MGNWYTEMQKTAGKLIRHKHLVVRAEVKSPPTTHEAYGDWMKELIEKIDMKLLSGPHVEYVSDEGNRGFTGVCIIKTSHVSMHTWDEVEPKLVQLDVYSCAPFNPRTVFAHFQQFDPVKLSYKFLNREHGLHEVNLGWKFRRKPATD